MFKGLFCVALAALATVATVPAMAREAPKRAVLVVAFGTSEASAQQCIDNLVDSAKAQAPGWEFRSAFTSNIIRRKLAREENRIIPTPMQALADLQDQGFSEVLVLSTHVIPGSEYDDLRGIVEALASLRGKYSFDKIRLGRPLLTDGEDCETMVELLEGHYGPQLDQGEALVLMGHGTHHMANGLYSQVQTLLNRREMPAYLATVEGLPDYQDVVVALKKEGITKVLLAPFMVVAGDHALNDMAGEDDPESWISMLRAEGFQVRAALDGLGRIPGVLDYFGARAAQDLALMQ